MRESCSFFSGSVLLQLPSQTNVTTVTGLPHHSKLLFVLSLAQLIVTNFDHFPFTTSTKNSTRFLHTLSQLLDFPHWAGLIELQETGGERAPHRPCCDDDEVRLKISYLSAHFSILDFPFSGQGCKPLRNNDGDYVC